MLGFAVVDRPITDGDAAVWLVSKGIEGAVEATNAVLIQRHDPNLAATLDALLADRIVLLTKGTRAGNVPTHFPVVAGSLDALRDAYMREADRMRVEYLAEQRRRHSVKMAAVVEPLWPATREPQDVSASPAPVQAALRAAREVIAVWGAWVSLDTIRRQRAYLTPPSSDPILLPPGFDAATHPVRRNAS